MCAYLYARTHARTHSLTCSHGPSYLHNVDEVTDPKLRAVCTAVLKAVEHVTDVVNRSDVWEEEDFSAR